jgi:hypothetical protein
MDELEAEEIEDALAALVEEAPYIRFRTWKGKPTKEFPDPRTRHDWQGLVKDYVPEEGDAVDDETDEAVDEASEELTEDGVEEPPAPRRGATKAPAKTSPSQSKTSPLQSKKPAAPAKAPVKGSAPKVASGGKSPPPKKKAPPKVEEPDEPFDEFGDVDSLVEKATAHDQKSQDALAEMAISNGYTEAEVYEAASWQDVADMAAGPAKADAEETGEEAEEQEEAVEEEAADEVSEESETTEDGEPTEEAVEEAIAPQVGDVFLYRPIDPKTKKAAKASVECQVLTVNARKRTVTLKNMATKKPVLALDGKTPAQVSWDDFESE